MHSFRIPSNQHVLSIDQCVTRLATESFIDANAVNGFKNYFPQLVDKINNFFDFTPSVASLFSSSKKEEIIVLDKKKKYILANIRNFNYLDMCTIEVNKPQGSIGTYIEQLNVVNDLIEYQYKEIGKILDEFYAYVAILLSTEDAKKSTRDYTMVYKKLENKREEDTKKLGELISDSQYNSKVLIKNVVGRGTDFNPLFERVIFLDHTLKRFSFDPIKQKANKIKDAVNIIIEQTKRGDITNITPEISGSLSKGTLEVARQLEFLSALYFYCLTLNECINDCVDRVYDFMNK